MKIGLYILISSCFLLTGCPEMNKQSKTELEKNNYNFTNLQVHYKLGIQYKIPEMLTASFYNNFTTNSSNSITYSTADEVIHLSIEKFSSADASSIRYQMEETDLSDLEIIRDYYTQKRKSSVYSSESSEPTELYTRTKKKGWIQSVEDLSNGNYGLNYLLATIEYKGDYYVFQLIANKSIMPYLFDDMLTIIQSVR
jgi:hypothetical protein